MKLFAKVFGQIFDSSISSDYVVRHIFMDLLVLADHDGVVDMTLDAIARRTNVPEEVVAHAIKKLMEPDEQSRSGHEDGRRIMLLDSHRDWGWQIVNYEHYRQLHNEEARRTYFRDKKREYRAVHRKATKSNMSTDSPTMSKTVKDCPQKSTQLELEVEVLPSAISAGIVQEQGQEQEQKDLAPAARAFFKNNHGRRPDQGKELSTRDQAHMIGMQVGRELKVTDQFAVANFIDQAKLMLEEPLNGQLPTMDFVRDGLISRWKLYCECKRLHKVERPYLEIKSFFGLGIWRDSTRWKLKKGETLDGISV